MERITAYNKGLPKAGLKFFDWAFVLKIPAFGKPRTVSHNYIDTLQVWTFHLRQDIFIPTNCDF